MGMEESGRYYNPGGTEQGQGIRAITIRLFFESSGIDLRLQGGKGGCELSDRILRTED